MPFEDQDPLPENDVDAELARRIGDGQMLFGGGAFERALAGLRERVRTSALPPDLAARLWARIRPAASPRRPTLVPLWARWAAATAAVVLVVFGSWSLLRRQPSLVAEAAGSMVTAVLDDGSSVILRPNSSLRRSGDRYQLTGEAFFDVRHNPGRLFRVQTAVGEIRVLGTRFDVSTWGGQTEVFLEAGHIVFQRHGAGQPDTLYPGNVLSASDGHVVIRPAGVAEFKDWMDNTLMFGGRSLRLILAELEHHFGIRVSVPDAFATTTLSGQVLLSNPDQSLADLGRALGAEFELVGPRTYRIRPR